MADFMSSIDTYNYLYSQPVYVREISGQDQNFVALKVELNATNFNFSLAEPDGADFRLASASNGSGILQMWIGYWSQSAQRALVYFKLPYLAANDTKTLWAFWGRANDVSISDIRYMTGELIQGSTSTPVFTFGDDFTTYTSSTLNGLKWPTTNTDGYFNLGGGYLWLGEGSSYYIQSKSDAITSIKRGWVLEDLCYLEAGRQGGTSTSYFPLRYYFYGDLYNYEIRYFRDDSTDRQHSFVAGTLTTYNGTNKGLELYSYNHTYVGYYEPTDKTYQGIGYRDSWDDYEDSWERQVHRNTHMNYFRIYAQNNVSSPRAYLRWVIVREYDRETAPEIDLSALYVEYEVVRPQQTDFTAYQEDATSVDYYHETDIGGDPYRISDNITNSPTNIWTSDETTPLGGYVLIDFGRTKESITNVDYLHLDNSHLSFYNASKLSDNDTDVHSRTYWWATSASNVWAAIRFPTGKAIRSLMLKAVPGALNNMVKNFRLYGTGTDPRFATAFDKVLIYEGTCIQTTTEQLFYFNSRGYAFKYYILEAIDTYGSNLKLQEWGMYEHSSSLGRKTITQVRLHPAAFDSNEQYMPKEFELFGSNDNINWTSVARRDVYTPFFDNGALGRWQHHSIENEDAYYIYKIVFTDNWGASTNIFKVAEWELREKESEAYTFRILAGSESNVSQVWADPATTFDSGHVYSINGNTFNFVLNDVLANSTTVSGVDDLNVVI